MLGLAQFALSNAAGRPKDAPTPHHVMSSTLPPPPDEQARLAALRSFAVLDTAPEKEFDDLVELAALVCGTPMAAISLVDEKRQWFKARKGFTVPETPREISFCTHALHQRELFIVPDATKDERFAKNPLVCGAMHVNFYAGAPLALAGGAVLGTLMVMDREPRLLSAGQQNALEVLRNEVIAHLELRRRRNELQATEADRANILASALDGIVVIDHTGRICEFNPAAERIFGWSREAALGRTIEETIVPQEMRPQHREGLSRLMRTGEERLIGKRVELQGLRADGTTFPAELSIVRSPGAEPPRFIGFLRDISERKRAEAALRASEAKLRAIFDAEPECVKLLAPDATLHAVNNAGLRFIEAESAEPLLGQCLMPLVMPEDREAVAAMMAAVVAGERRTVQYRITGLKGTVRWLEMTGVPFLDEETGRKYVLGVSRDVTQRRQAEEALRQSEARFAKAFRSNPGAMCITSTQEGRFIEVNEHYCRLFGFTREELIGQSSVGLRLWADPEVRAKLVKRLTAHEPVRDYDTHFRRRNGELIDAMISMELIEFPGEPEPVIVSMFADLTERRKIEQQFLRAQRMESIGTLAGGIAHDLNNVLGPIVMSLDLLRMKCADADSLDLISVISASANRGAEMVKQVLSFARGVEGRRVEVKAVDLLRDIEKITNDTFLKHIRLRTSVSGDLWPVAGDPTQLHQVLLNLCLNARDAMPDGGTLTLSAENVTLDANYSAMDADAKPGPYVLLQVEDSGAGIPRDIVEKIFDPFFTTKELGKGTGLGLSTSLAIVKSHGGFIRVYSEPGHGTTFKIYLPAHTGPATAPLAGTQVEMPRGHGELILVVDDEASVRHVTQQTLEAFGYRIVTACDGADAVAIYAQRGGEFAAVLTDMMMPVMDGMAMITVLQRINPRVKIIAASGLVSNGNSAHLANLGVKHFLAKPYTAETLLKVIKETLSAA